MRREALNSKFLMKVSQRYQLLAECYFDKKNNSHTTRLTGLESALVNEYYKYLDELNCRNNNWYISDFKDFNSFREQTKIPNYAVSLFLTNFGRSIDDTRPVYCINKENLENLVKNSLFVEVFNDEEYQIIKTVFEIKTIYFPEQINNKTKINYENVLNLLIREKLVDKVIVMPKLKKYSGIDALLDGSISLKKKPLHQELSNLITDHTLIKAAQQDLTLAQAIYCQFKGSRQPLELICKIIEAYKKGMGYNKIVSYAGLNPKYVNYARKILIYLDLKPNYKKKPGIDEKTLLALRELRTEGHSFKELTQVVPFKESTIRQKFKQNQLI